MRRMVLGWTFLRGRRIEIRAPTNKSNILEKDKLGARRLTFCTCNNGRKPKLPLAERSGVAECYKLLALNILIVHWILICVADHAEISAQVKILNRSKSTQPKILRHTAQCARSQIRRNRIESFQFFLESVYCTVKCHTHHRFLDGFIHRQSLLVENSPRYIKTQISLLVQANSVYKYQGHIDRKNTDNAEDSSSFFLCSAYAKEFISYSVKRCILNIWNHRTRDCLIHVEMAFVLRTSPVAVWLQGNTLPRHAIVMHTRKPSHWSFQC